MVSQKLNKKKEFFSCLSTHSFSRLLNTQNTEKSSLRIRRMICCRSSDSETKVRLKLIPQKLCVFLSKYTHKPQFISWQLDKPWFTLLKTVDTFMAFSTCLVMIGMTKKLETLTDHQTNVIEVWTINTICVIHNSYSQHVKRKKKQGRAVTGNWLRPPTLFLSSPAGTARWG